MNRKGGPPSSDGAALGQAMARFREGRLAEADSVCRNILSENPGHAEALHLRGVIAHRMGRHDVAAGLIAQAVAIDGGNPTFHHNLGNVLQALGRLDAASRCFENVLALRPDAAEARFCLGNLLQQQGRLDEAVARYRRAVAIKPDYAEAWNNLGLALLELGQLAEAARASANAVRLAPNRARYWRNFAETRVFAPGDPALVAMEALLKRIGTPQEQAMLHFALGKAYGDGGAFERSAAHLRAGNALHRARITYDEAATLGLMRRIEACFTPDLMRRAVAEAAGLPVFILGMPRSGTSLVEQILASHTQIHGGGEREAFGQAVARLEGEVPFPECVGGLDDEALRGVGEEYLASSRKLAPGATRVTDKMPRNFLFAGLIHLALPGARLIHVRRDPADTCLSCFSKLFSGDHPYSYDLGELGRYHAAHARLMEHWRAVLPAGVLLEISYEELVADPEGQSRRMVAHCGLDWDSACLDFAANPRAVRTASAAQVRRKIHAGSIGRWRSYSPWLSGPEAVPGADQHLAGGDRQAGLDVSN